MHPWVEEVLHCGRQLFKGSLRLAHWHTPRIGRLSIQLPVRLCIERGFRRQADRGAVTDAFQYQRLSTGVSPARSARNCDSAAASLAPKWPFPVVKPASYLDSGPLNNPDSRDGSGLVEGPCCCGIDVRQDTAFAGLPPYRASSAWAPKSEGCSGAHDNMCDGQGYQESSHVSDDDG